MSLFGVWFGTFIILFWVALEREERKGRMKEVYVLFLLPSNILINLRVNDSVFQLSRSGSNWHFREVLGHHPTDMSRGLWCTCIWIIVYVHLHDIMIVVMLLMQNSNIPVKVETPLLSPKDGISTPWQLIQEGWKELWCVVLHTY